MGGETVVLVDIYLKRLLFTGGLALVGAYVGGSVGLHWWLDRQPHNQVGLADVFRLPWARDEFRRKLGETAVRQGIEQLRQRQYGEAFQNLRGGVARSPGNVDGRLLLARWMAAGDPKQAVALLESGLQPSGLAAPIVTGLFGLYDRLWMHRAALRRAESILAGEAGTVPDDTRILVEELRAGLLVRTGRTEEGVAAMAAVRWPEGDMVAARAHHRQEVDLLVRANRGASAREVFERHLRGGALAAEDLRREVEIAVLLGDADGLRRSLVRWRALAPEDPAVYLAGFSAWHRLGRATFQDAAEQEYYHLFGSNEAAMQAFAGLAASLKLPEVVRRARRTALDHRLSGFAFLVHLTEAHLRRGEPELAMRQLREWEGAIDTLVVGQRHHPEYVKRLARAVFSVAEAQDEALLSHLSGNRSPNVLGQLLQAIEYLEAAGNSNGAAKLVRMGLAAYPESDPLLDAEARQAARAGEAVVAAAGVPGEALPATEVAALAKLDDLLAADELAQTRDLLRALRQARPAWLGAAAAQLALREIELGLATLDPIASRSLIRGYVDRYRNEEDALRLAALAVRLAGAGRTAEARIVQEELLAVTGQSPRVIALLAAQGLAGDPLAVTTSREETFRLIDAALAGRRWADAEQVVRALRQAAPAWATGAETDLKVREIRLRLGLYQRPLALALLRDIVIRPGAPRSAAFRLVRDYLADNDQESAVLLAREIARLLPDDAAAEKLVGEAQAPRTVSADI